MKEKISIINEFLEVFNELRSLGVGRRAIVRNVSSQEGGSSKITILFPDMDYLISVCLALKAWPDVVIRVDGLFLLITIR